MSECPNVPIVLKMSISVTFLAYLVDYANLKILTSSPDANDDNHASEFEELFFFYIINRMFLLAWGYSMGVDPLRNF